MSDLSIRCKFAINSDIEKDCDYQVPTLHLKDLLAMKIAIKIPHSLDLTLSAIARSLANQNAVIDTFIILSDMIPDTGTLMLNYFNDIDCIFSVRLLKKSLSLTVICPQLAKHTQFVKYSDGDFATIHITNKTSLNQVNKKDKVIKLQTKIPCESFFSTNGENSGDFGDKKGMLQV